jgi:hypothetical protein
MIKLSTLKPKESFMREMGVKARNPFHFKSTKALQNLNLNYEANS